MAQKSPLESHRWTLVAVILASGIIFLTGSVVNVALPAIDRSLSAGLSGLQWIVDGYVLTLAAFLIPGGALGDRYGRRRVMTAGLVGFGLTAVAAGFAPSLPWLVGARLVQGMMGALVVPGSLAIIRSIFPAGPERGRAIGLWSGWSGLATVFGPLLGGWLIDTFSWRWAFFVAVPLVTVTVWLMLSHVPESREERSSRHLDGYGAALAVVALGGLAYGLIEGPVSGWRAPWVVAGLASGGIALLLFPIVEARIANPMVPPDLFKSRNFTGANLTTLGVYFGLYGLNFFLVIYLQNVLGYSALNAGLALAPTSLLLLLLSPRFGKWAGRYGPRWFMTGGPLVLASGLLALLRLQPGASFWTALLPGVILVGLGLAATVAPLTDTVMSAVPERRSGVAAAFNNVVSRVAALLAIAGLGVVVSLTFDAALQRETRTLALSGEERAALERISENPTGGVDRSQLPPEVAGAVDAAYTAAFHRTMQVTAGAAVLGGLVAALTIRQREGHDAAA